jgi:hypothetical protein
MDTALSRWRAELGQACCRTCRRRRVGPPQIRDRGALRLAPMGTPRPTIDRIDTELRAIVSAQFLATQTR